MIQTHQRHWLSSGFHGPLIADDANTVAHVTFNGSALVDTFGNSWTQNGTVPQVGKAGRTPAGAGPFSDVNYYSLGTGNDVLDFTGAFSIAVVFSYASLPGAQQILFVNGQDNASGYYCGTLAGNTVQCVCSKAAAKSMATSGAAMVTGLNVFYGGWTTSNVVGKLNLGALVSTAFVGLVAGTALAARIGDYQAAGLSVAGTIHELWFSSTSPTDAAGIAIAERVKARGGVTAW